MEKQIVEVLKSVLNSAVLGRAVVPVGFARRRLAEVVGTEGVVLIL